MKPNVQDMQLERLVDGELNDDEVRELLMALSDEPDGWRRCALAFVEDQMLRGDLQRLGHEQREAASAVATSTRSAAPRWKEHAGLLLAMAACFVLAFFAGHYWSGQRAPSDRDTAGASGSHSPIDSSLASTGNGTTQPVAWPTSEHSPLGQFTLVVNDQENQPYDLPVYPLNDTTSQWLAGEQPSVPPELFEALRRAGISVQRDQFFAPVQLEDGRQVVIPIEQVEIVPRERSWIAY